ncbi:MAG: hypothetical protein EBT86_04310 [Actinobacteria bacterium]|nr:hypothetical protein [Actinomycetota bacterium]
MNPDKTPILRPEDLYSQRKTRDSARLRTYNQILEQIHHRIQTVSRLPSGGTSQILYTIPDFIFGLPRIDLEDCVVYLVYQLRTSGFDIKYTYPNLLNISWSHYERSYLLEQSPILQAMVDSKESAERAARVSEKKFKKVSKVLMSGGNEVIIQSQGEDNGSGGNNATKTTRKPKKEMKKTMNETYPSLAAIKTVLSAKDYVPPTSFMENLEKPVAVPSTSAVNMEAKKSPSVFMW